MEPKYSTEQPKEENGKPQTADGRQAPRKSMTSGRRWFFLNISNIEGEWGTSQRCPSAHTPAGELRPPAASVGVFGAHFWLGGVYVPSRVCLSRQGGTTRTAWQGVLSPITMP